MWDRKKVQSRWISSQIRGNFTLSSTHSKWIISPVIVAISIRSKFIRCFHRYVPCRRLIECKPNESWNQFTLRNYTNICSWSTEISVRDLLHGRLPLNVECTTQLMTQLPSLIRWDLMRDGKVRGQANNVASLLQLSYSKLYHLPLKCSTTLNN